MRTLPGVLMLRRLSRAVATLALAPALLALTARAALARAGGAGGHSGGGHSFGGGGSFGGHGLGGGGYGGSVGSFPGEALVALVIFLVIIFVIRSRIGTLASLPSTALPTDDGDGGEAPPEGPEVDAAAVATFLQAHPDFDIAAFQKKAASAFYRIQQAWSDQDVTAVRPFLSDGMLQRFATQFRMMKLLQQVNRLENVQVRRVELTGAQKDGAYDVIEVYIEASMRDSFVSALDHSRDSASDGAFAEYWSFLRKQNAPAPKGDMYAGQTCPACGAPLPKDMGEVGTCQYCHALVNSGEFDWVLSEITQQADHGARAVLTPAIAPTRDAAVTELLRRSPDFAVELAEDKASNAFMQIMTALATHDPTVMRRFVADDAFTRISAMIPADRTIFDRLYLNEAVLLDVRPNAARDVVMVGLAASMWRVRLLDDGRVLNVDAAEIQPRYVLVFERDRGAALGKGALYQHQCTACGAPVKDSLDVKCGYCGAVLNSTKSEWIVSAFLSLADYQRLYPAA